MKIGVCIKQVIDSNARLEISNVNIRAPSNALRMNEFDEFALEEAIRLKEKIGAEVIAITLGPLTAVNELTKAFAMGADKAIRIDNSILESWDANTTAKILSHVIGTLGLDLIFCGIQSTDDLYSQVGILVSEKLGLPHVSAVTHIEEINQEIKTAKLAKEVGGGFKQIVEVPLPAVLIIQSGINLPRYVSTIAMLQNRSKKVTGMSATAFFPKEELEKSNMLKILSLSTSSKERPSEPIVGTAPEIASILVQKLKEANVF